MAVVLISVVVLVVACMIQIESYSMKSLSVKTLLSTDYKLVRSLFSDFNFKDSDFTNLHLFNFYIVMRRHNDNESISKLLKNAERHSTTIRLERKFSDWKYLASYGFLFSNNTKKFIEKINSEAILSDEDINELEIKFLNENIELYKFISKCLDLYKKRYNSEYKYINKDPIDFFPYKYLSDFSSKPPSSSIKKCIKLSFVYCIKNRSRRAMLSIQSLINSYNQYSKVNLNIEIEIVIVEDFGIDLINDFNVSEFSGEIYHYVINTGLSWTRSGTLNYGIKRSSGDIVAFCDVDFLFHDQFFFEAEECILNFEFEKNILVVNCIESSNHFKGAQVYTKGSPYGYMWMVDSKLTKQAGGFSEEYIGHGFEDRDFQYKMTSLYGLKIIDSISQRPGMFVIHFSHNTRTGDDNRDVNKSLLEDRLLNSNFKIQKKWGEFPLLYKSNYNKGLTISDKMVTDTYDVVFLAHNSYHAWTYQILLPELKKKGLRTILLSPLPDYQDEGVEKFCLDNSIPFMRVVQFLELEINSLALIVFNDWDSKVSNPLVKRFNALGKKTIGLIEGINDYNDIDTGRNRYAYRTVSYVLIPGDFDRRHYFSDLEDRAYVVGIPRLSKIIPDKIGVKSNSRVLINANFTYGVLEEYRYSWIEDCVNACVNNGLDYIISLHNADQGDYSKFNVSESSFYDELKQSALLISRFSSCIIESLVVGVPVIYYNNGFESVYKFQEPNGAYFYAKSYDCLNREVRKIAETKVDSNAVSNFLNDHALFEADSSGKIVCALINILNKESL